MSKYIKVVQNGIEWLFPASKVAAHRADYYEKNDLDTTWQEEYDFTLDDEAELIDWFQNNMNPEDFKTLEVDRREIEQNYWPVIQDEWDISVVSKNKEIIDSNETNR